MHIRLHGISKRFGRIQAVDRVDFEARPGMVVHSASSARAKVASTRSAIDASA